jgi:hypothetical protein
MGVRAQDLERFFSVQQEAVDAAIRFANDSGKEGNPAVVLFQKSRTEFEKILDIRRKSLIRRRDRICRSHRARRSRKSCRTPWGRQSGKLTSILRSLTPISRAGRVSPVAGALVARDIGFVFVTACGDHGLLAYRNRPTLNKPFQIDALKRCCKSALAQSSH